MTSTTDALSNAGLTIAQPAGATGTGTSTIDQAGFLKLLTAQMQFQDPFQPLDNTQMVQQMAQFTQIQGQNQANTSLQTIADAVSGTRLSDAASWIGKAMLVKSNIATPDRSGAYAGELTLDGNADDVNVSLVDGSGNVVKKLDLGARSAGPVPFFWDGTDGNGNSLANGPLQVQVTGVTPSQTATWASIAAVQSPASGADAKLITALGNFSPSDALRLG